MTFVWQFSCISWSHTPHRSTDDNHEIRETHEIELIWFGLWAGLGILDFKARLFGMIVQGHDQKCSRIEPGAQQQV
jgi:hypothetical protein